MKAGDLVAVAVPVGDAWPGTLADLWETGAAIFPLDARLPAEEARRILDAARPSHVLDEVGLRASRDGIAVAPEVGLVVATSGTGGAPRLVELDRGAVERAVRSSAEVLGAGPGDGWLCPLPVAHMGGLLVVLRALLLGAPVTVHPRFDPAAFEAHRDAAFTSLVPTMLTHLLAAGAELDRFRAILVGGAAFPPEGRAITAPLVETYGLTESCGGVVYEGEPLPGVRVRIAESGEIQLRGPTLMRGYRLNPEATAAAFTRDGWLSTGDAGRMEGRRLVVEGRLDHLILTGGEKVWPEEIEESLLGHPGVADAAVAGRPDPDLGQRVTAYVVPSDPGAPPSLEDLREAAAARLPRFKAPRELVLVDAVPRTASGKVRRSALPET